MLIAERRGKTIGASFAFRRDTTWAGAGVTLRHLTVLPPGSDETLERRLVEMIEQTARQLGAEAIDLGGATGAERDFYLSMGYRAVTAAAC